jgi:hypothetical protein
MQDIEIEGMTQEEKQAAINLYQYIKDLWPMSSSIADINLQWLENKKLPW